MDEDWSRIDDERGQGDQPVTADARDESWRTEREIDVHRQRFLRRLRARIAETDAKGNTFPFRQGQQGIKLSRADVEWLLATHESSPVDWADRSQRLLHGPNINGAILDGVNLARLPLARVNMRQASLIGANLEGAHLEGATLVEADLTGADLSRAHLEGADVRAASLRGANLYHAHLDGAILAQCHLERADLGRAHVERADIRDAHLAGADLTLAYMDVGTMLDNVLLSAPQDGAARVADLHWSDVNITVVRWDHVSVLGDEQVLSAKVTRSQDAEGHARQLRHLELAVRANRQVAVVLRAQGISEAADRFAYRAQRLQRNVFRLHRDWGRYCFFSFLQRLAGYGYRPGYALGWYSVTLLVSTLIFWWQAMILAHPHVALTCSPGGACIGQVVQPHTWYQLLGESVLASVTFIHGRGFFPGQLTTGWQMLMAAIDAVAGLVIEASFVATFVQRFFTR